MDEESLLAAKMEALAEFAAGAGHEINNPLAAISGRAQQLLKGEVDPERRRHLLTIGAQALRIRDMIGDVMLFARPPEPRPRLIDLADVVDEVIAKFDDDIGDSQLTVAGDRLEDLFVWADESQLRVVLSELFRNAIHFSPIGSTIHLDTAQPTARFARFAVRDVRGRASPKSTGNTSSTRFTPVDRRVGDSASDSASVGE